jgi:hypothetical protein
LTLGKTASGLKVPPSHWSSSLADPGAGPRNEGHPYYGFTGADRSPRYWCHVSCVWLFPRELLTCVWVSDSDNSRQATSYISATTVGCYFVAPTLANIQRIAEDLRKGLYENSTFRILFRGRSWGQLPSQASKCGGHVSSHRSRSITPHVHVLSLVPVGSSTFHYNKVKPFEIRKVSTRVNTSECEGLQISAIGNEYACC